MSTIFRRLVGAGAAGLLAVGLAACGSNDANPPPAADSASQTAPVQSPAAQETSGASASQTLAPLGPRKDITGVLESQMSDLNAEARWEGDVMHMRLDGTRDDPMNGRHCRMFATLLEPTDSFVLEFADGSIPCSEVPGA